MNVICIDRFFVALTLLPINSITAKDIYYIEEYKIGDIYNADNDGEHWCVYYKYHYNYRFIDKEFNKFFMDVSKLRNDKIDKILS